VVAHWIEPIADHCCDSRGLKPDAGHTPSFDMKQITSRRAMTIAAAMVTRLEGE